MPDIRDRFAALDRVPAPDLWSEIERRAATAASAHATEPLTLQRRIRRPAGSSSVRDDRPRASRGWAGLLALLLLCALLAATYAVGTILDGRRDPALVPPTAPLPSAALATNTESTAPTSAPTVAPTPAAGVCETVPAPAKPRISKIQLETYVFDVRFAACSMWGQRDDNGGGIDRIDVRTNRVVANVTPGEVVSAIATQGDAVWALVDKAQSGPGDHQQLVRIDAATNSVAQTIALPFRGSRLAIVGRQAWVADHRDHFIHVVDVDSSREVASIPMSADRLEVVPGSVLAVHPGEHGQEFSLIDTDTFVPTRIPAPVASQDFAIIGSQAFFGTESGEIVQVSLETGEVVRSTPVTSSPQDFIYLADVSDDVFVLPVRLIPNGTSFRLSATEILRFDGVTGDLIDRMAYVATQPIDLWAGADSLWLVTAEDPLIRIEVPARP
jgi:hypothetical protein